MQNYSEAALPEDDPESAHTDHHDCESMGCHDHGDKWHEDRQPVRVIKVDRNDPCPCKSGKKYKKCCLG